jgi:hypothetical protein
MTDKPDKYDRVIRLQESPKFTPKPLPPEDPSPVDNVVEYEESPAFDTVYDGEQDGKPVE